MYKLFESKNGYLYSKLKTHFKNLKILSPISLLHNMSENPGRNPKLNFVLGEVEELQSSKAVTGVTQLESDSDEPSRSTSSPLKAEDYCVQISHPWPEWVDLMECLLKRGYFEGDGNPFRNGQLGLRESKFIRTACLNFARDQYNLIRFLSRKDIKVIAGCGCPNLDRKVVNSGKRLRAHVGVNEGDKTCSSCNLRGDCERAYVKAREDEGGRTVDVMRFLLTYGLDPIAGTVENKPCLNKVVKESVRTLLKEMVEHSARVLDSNLQKSMTSEKVVPVQDHSGSQVDHINVPRKQGDWPCPKCNFLNFAKNIKCLRCDDLFEERLKQLREDQNHLPLKKGDWICDKCNFLNFARNTRCLQCKEKPPKRQLNPGEWECPSCNYINFRRNMVCLKCDHRRLKAASSETSDENDIENVGYRKNSGVRFIEGDHADVNIQTSLQRHRQNQNNGANMWRSAEQETEELSILNLRNEASGFVDFPIAGGKSDLSQNAEKRDRWKSEMLERSKGTFKAKIEDDELSSATIQRRLEFPNCADDEEMAEWFGSGKLGRKGIVHGPRKFRTDSR